MTKEIRSANAEGAQECDRFGHSDFGIPSDFAIRHSDLGPRFMESPHAIFAVHWDLEPMAIPHNPKKETH
jgi:hypothetical protein